MVKTMWFMHVEILVYEDELIRRCLVCFDGWLGVLHAGELDNGSDEPK